MRQIPPGASKTSSLVSNSGRLKAYCYELAAQHNYPWEVVLHQHPDQYLIEQQVLACSADAFVLNELRGVVQFRCLYYNTGSFS